MKPIKLFIDPALKELDLATKRSVTSSIMGRYKSVFKGRGLEFDSYKDYTPEDDATYIDWKASMRANMLLTKTFTEERDLSVYFLIDVSESMLIGKSAIMKNEFVASLVASLAVSITQANDRVGFGFIADDLRRFHPAKGGADSYHAITTQLVDHSLYGGAFKFESCLKKALSLIPQGNAIILVSDFLGLTGDWRKYLLLAASKYDLIGLMVRDPIDVELPDIEEDIVIQDPYSNQQTVFQSSRIKNQYKNYVQSQIREVRSVFQKSQSDFVLLTTDEGFGDPLVKLFRLRSEKWR